MIKLDKWELDLLKLRQENPDLKRVDCIKLFNATYKSIEMTLPRFKLGTTKINKYLKEHGKQVLSNSQKSRVKANTTLSEIQVLDIQNAIMEIRVEQGLKHSNTALHKELVKQFSFLTFRNMNSIIERMNQQLKQVAKDSYLTNYFIHLERLEKLYNIALSQVDKYGNIDVNLALKVLEQIAKVQSLFTTSPYTQREEIDNATEQLNIKLHTIQEMIENTKRKGTKI